jgi:2-hydroxychromene-2-carboxylate isomerase
MTKQIDYFFGIGSPWAYIGFDAFRDLAGRFDATVVPYVIPLVEENGGIFSRNRPEPRRNYWTKDLKRWAAHRGKVLNFDNRGALSDPGPAGLAVIAAHLDGKDWAGLADALQTAFWGGARDIGKADIRADIANAAGFDAAVLERRLGARDVLDRWTSNYEIARQAGVFGFPTFRYDGELYWGQDSLPFLERHLAGEKLSA